MLGGLLLIIISFIVSMYKNFKTRVFDFFSYFMGVYGNNHLIDNCETNVQGNNVYEWKSIIKYNKFVKIMP